MKKKFVVVLVLALMIGLFTGCEIAPTIPQLLTTVRGYHEELNALVASNLEGITHTEFERGDSLPISQGVAGRINYVDSSELSLKMTLDNWVAGNGAEVSGTIYLNILYDTNIASIRTERAYLYFDRTSVSYEAEVFDGDSATEAFTSGFSTFHCTSMIVDGKTLILQSGDLRK